MVAKSISYRKAKFDEGVNAVQSKVNQLSSIPTLFDGDAEYLNKKIGNLTNTINSNDVDFSNSFNLSKIDGDSNDISSDSTIINAASSAKNHQKQLKFMDDAKNNPKKYGDVLSPYNERDYSDNLRAYQNARANGQEAVFSYQYKPFVDVQGTLAKSVEKLKASATSMINGNYFIDGEELTPAVIRNRALSQLQTDPKLRTQMSINSRYDTEGMTDESLIKGVNTIHHSELLNYKRNAQAELARLMSLDPKDPNKTAERIAQAKTAFQTYSDSSDKLEKSISSIQNGTYNRQQYAEFITQNNILKGLDSYAYSKTKIRANIIPITLGKMEFDRQKSAAQLALQYKIHNDNVVQNGIENQLRKLEIDGRGAKTKLQDDLSNDVGRDNPEIKAIDDPVGVFEATRDSSIKDTREYLKDEFKKRISSIGKLDDAFVSQFVDGMMRNDGTSAQIDVDKATKKLHNKLIEYGGTSIPEDKAIKSVLYAANKLSLDVKKVFETGEVLSKDNSEFLSNYTKMAHKNAVLNDLPQMALSDALTKNGMSKDDYYKLKNLSTQEKVNEKNTYNSYSPMGGSVSGGLVRESFINQNDRAKLTKVENDIKQYHKDKQSFTKLYPVQNYTDKTRKDSDVDNNLNRVLSQGRISQEGDINLGGTVYGKQDFWTKNKGTRVEAVDYNWATQKARVRVYGLNGDTEVLLNSSATFTVPREYMETNVSPLVKKGSKDLTDSDLLQMANNGKMYSKNSKGEYKLLWGNLPNRINTPYTASLVNVGKNDNTVQVSIKLPVKGVTTTIDLPGTYTSSEAFQKEFTTKSLQLYDDLKKLGIPEKEIPKLVAEKIINSL
jgi:hypothetical protein